MSDTLPVELPGEFDVSVRSIPIAPVPEGIGQSFWEDAPAAELMEVPEGSDPALEFRKTLGMFATGVTVITTQVGEQVHGMTANAFM